MNVTTEHLDFPVQKRYRDIAQRCGKGSLRRTKHGAFVVYSRIPPTRLLDTIREVEPSITSLTQLKTIFLMGPTPTFFGETRASTSWRREYLETADNVEGFDARFMVVIPEPEDCDWKSVDYDEFDQPMEHVYAQLHWENYFINLAATTGILVLHAHFRWAGNAGPTARFEGGKMFALMSEDKVNACVLNSSPDTQTGQYIEAHLLDALPLILNGRFALTRCSPLTLSSQEKFPAGVYPNGGSEEGALLDFFTAINNMALSI